MFRFHEFPPVIGTLGHNALLGERSLAARHTACSTLEAVTRCNDCKSNGCKSVWPQHPQELTQNTSRHVEVVNKTCSLSARLERQNLQARIDTRTSESQSRCKEAERERLQNYHQLNGTNYSD